MRVQTGVCGVVVLVAGAAMALPPSSAGPVSDRAIGVDPFPAGGGEFTDDFESYPLGEICGMNGWEEWNGSVDVCASVTDEQASSGTQSLVLVGAVGGNNGQGDDTVQLFDVNEGQWTFSCQTYVPDDASGEASIILLNTYPAAVNSDWSVVVALNADLGTVADFNGTLLAALKKGEWVEFRTEIDLAADTCDYYYGDEYMGQLSWTGGIQAGGQPRIQCLDLYGGEPGTGTTGTYIDDVALVPAGGGCPADCNGDGVLNILDFVCFQGEWQSQTGAGDCDGNGLYNILDFVCYQGTFQQGCP